MVFIATTDKRESTQVFLLDLSAPEGSPAVRQMTDDDDEYAYPALSPDGSKIAVHPGSATRRTPPSTS